MSLMGHERPICAVIAMSAPSHEEICRSLDGLLDLVLSGTASARATCYLKGVQSGRIPSTGRESPT
jgi:hypothetical protein